MGKENDFYLFGETENTNLSIKFSIKCDWTRELKTKQQVPVGIGRVLLGGHP